MDTTEMLASVKHLEAYINQVQYLMGAQQDLELSAEVEWRLSQMKLELTFLWDCIKKRIPADEASPCSNGAESPTPTQNEDGTMNHTPAPSQVETAQKAETTRSVKKVLQSSLMTMAKSLDE